MDFRALVDELLAEYFRLDPVHATEIGNHDHDGEWPDLTDAGRAARLAFAEDAIRRLGEVDVAALSRDDAIDHRILKDAVEAMRFSEGTLEEDRWNPLVYVYVLGNGLFTLVARPFAPLPDRLRSGAARVRGVPAVLDAARATLSNPGERPVSRFHAEKAVERLPGVPGLVDTLLAEVDKVEDAEVAAALRAELEPAAADAKAALEAFGTWLRDELLPTATGDFRLGPALYRSKFRHALRVEMEPTELRARALGAFDAVRAEMHRLAADLWPTWKGDDPMPDQLDAMTRAVLDAIAADHPQAGELLDFCREENDRIETFCRDIGLIGLADEPLEIVWTPEFLRSSGGAMLIPPGPLDRGLSSFFAITPMPDDWTDAQRESYLREDNNRMLRLLTIHEAVPGHYLQLAYSNRCPSLVRAIFGSGVFAEGWAVYVTQVMMDVGYGAEDPALMLVHWKFYLRAITNTMMDIAIHTGAMEREEAMKLMVEQGFQEESEASAKWDRARLSSTQLCEYFLGYTEMADLEREARRRAAEAGTPFRWRPFLESVLAHGTPPTPVIRDILFGST
ncbi:MAG TPA: DUF885 domain-containing protein [Candidatus Limnocylindria bacterium]|nr:DUF885 domain-containing protein [Candidatus Limnocylindria bacterium]